MDPRRGLNGLVSMIDGRYIGDLAEQITAAPSEFFRHCKEQDLEIARIREYLQEIDNFAFAASKKAAKAFTTGNNCEEDSDFLSDGTMQSFTAVSRSRLSAVLNQHFPSRDMASTASIRRARDQTKQKHGHSLPSEQRADLDHSEEDGLDEQPRAQELHSATASTGTTRPNHVEVKSEDCSNKHDSGAHEAEPQPASDSSDASVDDVDAARSDAIPLKETVRARAIIGSAAVIKQRFRLQRARTTT